MKQKPATLWPNMFPPREDEPVMLSIADSEPQADQSDRPDLTYLKELDATAFNTAAEPMFLALICSLLDDGALSVREAIVEASFELNISPETAKRYLSKHSARRARFSLAGGKVNCKIHRHQPL